MRKAYWRSKYDDGRHKGFFENSARQSTSCDNACGNIIYFVAKIATFCKE